MNNSATNAQSPKKGLNKSKFGQGSGWLKLFALIIAALATLPFWGIIWNSLGDSNDVWPHLISYVLPNSALTTFHLLIGVGLLVFVIGTTTAWFVSRFDFPFKKVFEWALVLPLAIPTYISAYVYVEFLDFSGPVQSLLRSTMGFESIQDYWFPDIRSTGGAIFLLSLVLYPYVYLPARLSFHMQNSNILDVGRVLGANSWALFAKIAVPAARPAIAIGVLLVLMESLNDIGAVEYLGVRTLTLSVYDTWLNRSSLAGAAQIALFLLALIFLIVHFERRMRARKNYQDQKNGNSTNAPIKLIGLKAGLVFGWCFLPILLGFIVPFMQILQLSIKRPEALFSSSLVSALLNSVLVALLTAVVCLSCAFLMVYYARNNDGKLPKLLKSIASFGYAIPGTILALGIISIISPFDNFIDRFFLNNFGVKTGLLITGGIAILIYAYSARFLTIAVGSIEAGYEKISSNLSDASRALGRTEIQTVVQIDLPLLKRAFLTAALLVSVDTIKELPATLLLRPFNFDTLATFVYERASRAVFDEAAIAALLIVIVGLVPVYLLTKVINSEQ